MKTRTTQIILVLLILLGSGTFSKLACKPIQKPQRVELNYKKGDTIRAKVISVTDGDTYRALTPKNENIRVRMEGIDAPEKSMPFYNRSKEYLNNLCYEKEVTIIVTGIDRYERVLAYTYLDGGKELSREMLKAGYAWHYKQYNKDNNLANLENKARNAKRGLWVDKNPQPPWEFRRKPKTPI